MPTVHDYRRANLRKLANSVGGPGVLSKKLGYTNSSFLVQMAGPNPIRQVSEETARRFESTLDLLPGSLDAPVDIASTDLINPADLHVRQVNMYRKRKGLEPVAEPAVKSDASMMSREQLAELVAMVGKVCEESDAKVSTGKFADIIALALLAKDDRKGGNNEDYVRLLVSLTK